MLSRDLKMQAMMLATQLPDDELTARRVYALLGELIDQWIFNEAAGQSSPAPLGSGGNLSSASDSALVIPSVFPK